MMILAAKRVIYDWAAEWKGKWLEEGIARRREEGREEVIHELEAWDERRRAEERGEEFNEPPPFTGGRSVRV